ncbi:MAG: flagellar hook-basal body complex protein FliE [Candidatus Krumholzibacteriia bacterium]|jgi:flagellar hook-basal body complex protein FliE
MSIGSIKALGSIDPRSAYGAGNATGGAPASFASQLQNAISDVQQLQVKREDMIEEMVTGQTTEVHDVMIAAKESQLAFELLMEVRNKLLESYQEMMRMPV